MERKWLYKVILLKHLQAKNSTNQHLIQNEITFRSFEIGINPDEFRKLSLFWLWNLVYKPGSASISI